MRAQVIYNQENQKSINIDLLAGNKIGPQGLKGDSAYTVAKKNGFQGTEEQWLASLKGQTGDIGPQGQKGDKGDTGATGPQGQKGDKGQKGQKGDKGDTGMEGPQGPRGQIGPQGPKGDTGERGPRGYPGEKGERGYPFTYEDFTQQQLEGLRGPQGIQGQQGPKGDKGDTGAQGPQGIEGPQGIQGPPGIQGETGPQGLKGDKGDKGEKGQKGDKGDPGNLNFYICSSSEYNSETRVPTVSNPDGNTFYLVPAESETSPDLFVEWIYVNNKWEMFGSATVDLSDYITDVQIDSNSIVNNGVATIPIAADNVAGVVKVNDDYGISIDENNKTLKIQEATSAQIKNGVSSYAPVVPEHQHESAFYGLAKAAGDVTQAQSSSSVGTYTADAKDAIKLMLGIENEGFNITDPNNDGNFILTTSSDPTNTDVLANHYNANGAYAVGDYCIYENHLYKCNTAISSGEAWNLNHWDRINLTDEISDVKGDLTQLNDAIYGEGGGWQKDTLTFNLNSSAWSSLQEYNFVAGTEYTITIDSSTYDVGTNGAYIRLYKEDGVTYDQPVSGKFYAPITFTPENNYSYISLGRGYTPSVPTKAEIKYYADGVNGIMDVVEDMSEAIPEIQSDLADVQDDVSATTGRITALETTVNGSSETVSTTLSFPVNSQAWSMNAYSFESGQTYTVAIDPDTYPIAEYGVYVRLYKSDQTTYISPVEGKQYATFSFTPSEDYAYLSIGRGYSSNPGAATVYVSYTLTEDALTDKIDDVADDVDSIKDWVSSFDIVQNCVFSPSSGWLKSSCTMKEGATYTIDVDGYDWTGRMVIRFYLSDGTTNYQSTTYYGQSEFPVTITSEHDYAYVGMVTLGDSGRSGNVTITVSLNELNNAVDVVNDIIFINATQAEEASFTAYPEAVNGDTISNKKAYRDYIKYQYTPVWGGETLASYYNKLNGNTAVVIVLDGDSITQEGYRNDAIDSIMYAGGYTVEDESGALVRNYTLYNNGQGGASTKEWVGTGTAYTFNGRSIPANGMLDDAMNQNPDLLMVAFGTNDAATSEATIQARTQTYLANLEEGLKRIRGNTSVNGRTAYNRPIDELGVIVCNAPISTFGGNRANEKWHAIVRKPIMELCRQYGCAFVDFSLPTYSVNSFSKLNIWGDYGVSDASLHPGAAFSKYYASVLQPLLLPFGMWKLTAHQAVAKSGTTANKPANALIPVGYQYYCTDNHAPIYCSDKGEQAVGTFTIGSISSISSVSPGDFRIIVGGTSVYFYILQAIITRAGADGASNLPGYFAKIISNMLNARGYESTCSGNTFTLKAKSRSVASTASFTDNITRGATGLPITATLTTSGSSNVFRDITGNVVS